MSPDAAVIIDGLSKSYLVGHNAANTERYTALRDVVARNAHNLLRKTRDMIRGLPIIQGDEVEEFWALKDVSFEINRGDRIGIIGRNGAGKSTLLKILSRITEPTKGRIQITGRVASLLEVGTGFHTELSGRENIFLNGAILGMSRREIQRNFDEIVAFADVEKFLDTPVKRYSSGMYVRLAFAVAAHLETEILIVDEVLAVGDAQFQKKCLGKMEEVGKQGRTILFVSHNMAMVSSLCDKAILLENGMVRAVGAANSVILRYATASEGSPTLADYRRSGRFVGDQHAQLLSVSIQDEKGNAVSEVSIDEPFSVRMEYRVASALDRKFLPYLHFYCADGSCAFIVNAGDVERMPPGEYAAECFIPGNFLNDGLYSIRAVLASFESGVSVHFDEKSAITFNVRDPITGIATRAGYSGAIPGVVRPLLPWIVKPIGSERP